MKLKNKKSRNIIGIIQSCLIFALVILVIFMMIQINRLQGTARVINYAGLVRGATPVSYTHLDVYKRQSHSYRVRYKHRKKYNENNKNDIF